MRVNTDKSKVERPWECKFLGYSFYRKDNEIKMKVHEKSICKLKDKLKLLTGRSKIGNITTTYEKIKQLVVGWINYFKLADMKSSMRKLDEWLRRCICQLKIRSKDHLILGHFHVNKCASENCTKAQ